MLADYDDLIPSWQRGPVQALYRWSLGHAPALWRTYYWHTNRPAATAATRALARAGLDRAAALIARTDPDAIISTFSGAAALLGGARPAHVPHVVVATDYAPHRHWLRAGVDRICVPTHDAAAALDALGAARAQVIVTGLPVRACVTDVDVAATRAAVRARHGLDARPVVVVAAGAEPTPRAQRVVDALARLTTPAQLVICHPARLPRLAPGVSARVVGVTAGFPAWLAAADVLVGKAGGATVAEACALGRAMIVVDPYPGQEEDNAAWLERTGAAVRASGPATACAALTAVLTQPHLRAPRRRGRASRASPRRRRRRRPHPRRARARRATAHPRRPRRPRRLKEPS
ncbi:MAG: hypothetical protein IPL61_06515 [Myxococcales bacterium]|nr:hypothetical protein [Myxococcales bacterium]